MTEPSAHDEAIAEALRTILWGGDTQSDVAATELRVQLAAKGLEITEIGAREKALREAAETSAERERTKKLINMLPTFNVEWPSPVQDQWFGCFGRLYLRAADADAPVANLTQHVATIALIPNAPEQTAPGHQEQKQ